MRWSMLFAVMLFIVSEKVNKLDTYGWITVDRHTIEFTGSITENAVVGLDRIATPEIKTIRIDSSGGSVESALKISDYIINNKISVVVSGECLSSCANFIFLSGKNKFIERGSILGFHGNTTSGKKRLIKDILNQIDSSNTSILQKKSTKKIWLDEIERLSIKEQIYNKKIGVLQLFFSCSENFVVNNKAIFWIPTLKDLNKFGIEDIRILNTKTIHYSLPSGYKTTNENSSLSWSRECMQ